jgi:hypothetical protein
MVKQTKKSAAEAVPLVAVAAPVVAATPVSSSSVEPKKRAPRLKQSEIVKQAAALSILLHAKRPATDYIYFCQETRARIMTANPTFTFKQVGQEQGRLWKELPAEAKAVYKARQEADKKRYEEEKARVEQGRAQHPEIFDQLDKIQSKRADRANKKKSSVKRARSAFIIYCQEQRPILKQTQPTLEFKETGKVLGQQWKALPADKKAKYEAEAKKDADRYYAEKQVEMDAATQASAAAAPAAGEKKKAGRKPKAANAAAPNAAAANAAAPNAAAAAAPTAPAADKKKPGRKPKSADGAEAAVASVAASAAGAPAAAPSAKVPSAKAPTPAVPAEKKKPGRKPKSAGETA